MTKTMHPWELVADKDVSQLVFSFESVLTEMRRYANVNPTIAGWVRRLDLERDSFVHTMASRPPVEPNPALPVDPLDGWDGMESAPKDGTRVLALVTQKQFYRDTQTPNELIPVVVRWGGEYQEWSMPGLGGLRPTLWKAIELSEKLPAEPNAHEAFHAFARRYGLSRETVVAIAQELPTYDTLKANALKSSSDRLNTPQGEPALTSPRELPGTRESVVIEPQGNADESPALFCDCGHWSCGICHPVDNRYENQL